jgi:hypothetical protein
MRRGIAVLALTFPFVLFAVVHAGPQDSLSVRELVIRANSIVLAEPIEPFLATARFKAREVFRGRMQPGDTITLDLRAYDLRVVDPTGTTLAKPSAGIEQALLFLGPRGGTREQPGFQPLDSGVRFWTRDHLVLAPVWWRDSRGYAMTVREDLEWDSLLRQVRADGTALNRLLHWKDLPPTPRRNQALLAWIEQHRREFGAPVPAGSREKPMRGWGDLETQVFHWVLASGSPEDCWSAVKLYAELNHGANPPLPGQAFGSTAGRTLLVRLATAPDTLEGDRLRALSLLSDRRTQSGDPSEGNSSGQPLGLQEQGELFDRLLPLLQESSAPVRGAAAAAIRSLRDLPPTAASDPNRKSERILTALVKAYRAEALGEVRDELAEAICVIGGPNHWRELTGNPPNVVVRLCDLGRRDKQVFFWLNLRPCGQVVHECPTLLLEHLDKAGKTLDKKKMPLPVVNLPRPWNEGWDGQAYLMVQFAVTDFKPGTWRIAVEGTVGKGSERMKWKAEPKTFVIEGPPRLNVPNFLEKKEMKK